MTRQRPILGQGGTGQKQSLLQSKHSGSQRWGLPLLLGRAELFKCSEANRLATIPGEEEAVLL